MYRKKFRVTGQDVDDFMVMQDFAYDLYTHSLMQNFLIESGYSKQIRERLTNHFKNSNKQLTCLKNLMFTQDFFVHLDCFDIMENDSKITMQNRFFNTANELCATITINA